MVEMLHRGLHKKSGTRPVLRAADVAGTSPQADGQQQSAAKKRRTEWQPQPSGSTEAGKHFVDFAVRPWAEGDQDVDPRALWCQKVAELAERIRGNPTLPCGAASALQHDACWHSIDLLPVAHCAFQGCQWEGDSEDSLCQHLQEAHELDLGPCIQAAKYQTWWRGDLGWQKKDNFKEL